jgi:hypothetical protein
MFDFCSTSRPQQQETLTAKSIVAPRVGYRSTALITTSRLGLDRTPKQHSLPTEKEVSEGAELDGIAGHTHQAGLRSLRNQRFTLLAGHMRDVQGHCVSFEHGDRTP